MKKVTIQIIGQSAKTIDTNANTIREALVEAGVSMEGLSFQVNGAGAGLDDEINSYDFISGTQAVKGGIVDAIFWDILDVTSLDEIGMNF